MEEELRIQEEQWKDQEREQREFEIAHDRESYMTVDEKCPSCGRYPLEEQYFGFEKSVFCTNCSYQRTEEIQ